MIDLLTRLRGIREGEPPTYVTTTTFEARAEAKGLDVYTVVERAAIMEYDGGVPRAIAEQYALGEINNDQLIVMLANN